MNPLVALLTPQAPRVDIASAGRPGVGATLPPVDPSLGNPVGNSAVKVDSTAFIELLTSATATGQAATATPPLSDIAPATSNPIDALIQRALARSDVAVPETQPATASLQDSQKLSNQTLSQLQQAAAQQIKSNIPSGAAGAPSAADIADKISKLTGFDLRQPNQIVTEGALASTHPSAKIVRPTAPLAEEGNLKLALVAAGAALSTATNTAEAGLRKNQSFLSDSSKILKTDFTNAGATAPQPPANQDVINIQGTLAQAAKAYVKFEGKEQSEAELYNGNKPLTLERPAPSVLNAPQSANNNEVTINNLTALQPSYAAYNQAISKAVTGTPLPHHATPADQASVKIANAIQNGIRHIQIELEPAKLGRLDVRMELSHEGTSKLIVYVEKTETLSLLHRDASILEKALNDAGFKTDSGSLSFSLKGDGGEGDNKQLAGGSNKKNGINAIGQVGEKTGAGSVQYTMRLGDSVVDITV